MDLFLGSYWGKKWAGAWHSRQNRGLFIFSSFPCIPLTLRNCPGLSEWSVNQDQFVIKVLVAMASSMFAASSKGSDEKPGEKLAPHLCSPWSFCQISSGFVGSSRLRYQASRCNSPCWSPCCSGQSQWAAITWAASARFAPGHTAATQKEVKMLALVMQRVYFGIKEPSKWGFQGLCNPAPRGSFTSALSGALALCRDQQEKPLQHLISLFRQGIFKTTISLYLYLLKRSSSPLPAVFVPMVALEGHGYTLCVLGSGRESQTEPCTVELFSSCFFILKKL